MSKKKLTKRQLELLHEPIRGVSTGETREFTEEEKKANRKKLLEFVQFVKDKQEAYKKEQESEEDNE